jgi:hypothetical protein
MPASQGAEGGGGARHSPGARGKGRPRERGGEWRRPALTAPRERGGLTPSCPAAPGTRGKLAPPLRPRALPPGRPRRAAAFPRLISGGGDARGGGCERARARTGGGRPGPGRRSAPWRRRGGGGGGGGRANGRRRRAAPAGARPARRWAGGRRRGGQLGSESGPVRRRRRGGPAVRRARSRRSGTAPHGLKTARALPSTLRPAPPAGVRPRPTTPARPGPPGGQVLLRVIGPSQRQTGARAALHAARDPPGAATGRSPVGPAGPAPGPPPTRLPPGKWVPRRARRGLSPAPWPRSLIAHVPCTRALLHMCRVDRPALQPQARGPPPPTPASNAPGRGDGCRLAGGAPHDSIRVGLRPGAGPRGPSLQGGPRRRPDSLDRPTTRRGSQAPSRG